MIESLEANFHEFYPQFNQFDFNSNTRYRDHDERTESFFRLLRDKLLNPEVRATTNGGLTYIRCQFQVVDSEVGVTWQCNDPDNLAVENSNEGRWDESLCFANLATGHTAKVSWAKSRFPLFIMRSDKIESSFTRFASLEVELESQSPTKPFHNVGARYSFGQWSFCQIINGARVDKLPIMEWDESEVPLTVIENHKPTSDELNVLRQCSNLPLEVLRKKFTLTNC